MFLTKNVKFRDGTTINYGVIFVPLKNSFYFISSAVSKFSRNMFKDIFVILDNVSNENINFRDSTTINFGGIFVPVKNSFYFISSAVSETSRNMFKDIFVILDNVSNEKHKFQRLHYN